jgi:hypothetical protein
MHYTQSGTTYFEHYISESRFAKCYTVHTSRPHDITSRAVLHLQTMHSSRSTLARAVTCPRHDDQLRAEVLE